MYLTEPQTLNNIFKTSLNTYIFKYLLKGRAALHWAAAMNNLHAMAVLLRAGANRDVQSELEETPLFLAAREGSDRAVQMLLDFQANRDVTDHMDR